MANPDNLQSDLKDLLAKAEDALGKVEGEAHDAVDEVVERLKGLVEPEAAPAPEDAPKEEEAPAEPAAPAEEKPAEAPAEDKPAA